MTIWCVQNRPDVPVTVIATAKRPNILSELSVSLSSQSSTIITTTKTATEITAAAAATVTTQWPHPSNVKWMPMNGFAIGLKLSSCWHLILYAIIIISVISQIPSTANGANNGKFGSLKMFAMADAASTSWSSSSNFFDSDRIQCPSFVDNSACPCYKFEDGKSTFLS